MCDCTALAWSCSEGELPAAASAAPGLNSRKNKTPDTSCEDDLSAGLYSKVTLKPELGKWFSGQGHFLCLCENLNESLGQTDIQHDMPAYNPRVGEKRQADPQ